MTLPLANPLTTDVTYDAVIIGAGQAGLAAGFHLQQSGLRFVILDAEEQPGGSWPQYYKSLRLFSPARFSSLPGLPFPGDPERYPTRDETVAYLRQYATQFQLPIISGARAEHVTRDGALFTVRTTDGRSFSARSVIAAGGAFHRPQIPEVSGLSRFRGTVIHSHAYQEPSSFTNKRVIVVGAGNSAVQVAAELARVAHVSIASRNPVRLIRQRFIGRDVHFWWWLFGLDTSKPDSMQGRIFRRLLAGEGPAVLDAGIYRAALNDGKPEQRPMFTRFTDDGVVWADDTTEKVDAVIFATGFLPNLDYLAPLGALDNAGNGLQQEGVSKSTPGLYFMGLSYQRTFASATLRGVGTDAAALVQQLQQFLDTKIMSESSTQTETFLVTNAHLAAEGRQSTNPAP